MSAPAGIDPRGPRFAATITSALLLVATFLGVTGLSTARASASFGWFAYQPLSDATFLPGGGWAITHAALPDRVLDPAFLLTLLIGALFLWGVVAPTSTPWSLIFRRIVRPRLAAPTYLEDPRPPRFAQGVGLAVVGAGLLLHLAGIPWALPLATTAAFFAAFLNAAIGLCLGCRLYLLLQRAGGRGRAGAA